MFQPNPDFSRFHNAVKGRPTDRQPLCEALVGYGIMSEFLNKTVTMDDYKSQVEFWYKAGYDFIPVPVSLLTPGGVTEESKITQILKKMVLDKNPDETNPKAWNLEFSSFINDRNDFNAFPWNEASKIDYSKLDTVKEYLPEGMKIIVTTGKIFTLTWMLMGFSNLCIKLMEEPDLVTDVFKKIAEIQYSVLDRILEYKSVGAVWMIDDLAYSIGPMLSPDSFRQHVFPWYKDMAEKCHAKNKLVILHSDGNLDKLMPDFIDIGIDLLHPIDPTCWDIKKVKERYGDKIAVAGNVSNELLHTGTPAEVREYTKFLLEEIAPGGKFLLGSGNSVPDWAQFENYLTMRNTALGLSSDDC